MVWRGTLTVGAAEPEKCIGYTHSHTPAHVVRGGGKGSEGEKQQQIAAGTDAAASIFDEWVSCYIKYFINTNGTTLL